MKLYYSPGAGSMATHCLLAEIGKPYELQLTRLADKAQMTEAYGRINPKRQVPALMRDDGTVLTEILAIALWLAKTNPELELIPSDAEEFGRAIEIAEFVSTNLHPQGFTRLARTDKFTPNEADYEAVRERGWEIIKSGLIWLNDAIKGDPWVVGTQLSFADFSAFYVEYWAVHRRKLPLGPKCQAHFEAMSARPGIQRAIAEEGYPHQDKPPQR